MEAELLIGERIRKILYSKLDYFLKMQTIENMTISSNCVILYVKNKKSLELVEDRMKLLSPTYKFKTKTLSDNRIVVGSTLTPKDEYLFNEYVVIIQGEMLLQAQKKVLALKMEWCEQLKVLKESKQTMQASGEFIDFIKTVNTL